MFITFDFFCAYWQVKMFEDCKEITTLVCRYGRLMFEVMIFGLMNARSTFQQMMDHVRRRLSFFRLYIEDVVIFSRSLKEHVTHLKAVIDRIAKHGLKLKLSTGFFALSGLSLVGPVMNGDEVDVDHEKVAKIWDALIPTTTTELRSILGLTGCYQTFIRNFAETTAVLHSATSGNKKLR